MLEQLKLARSAGCAIAAVNVYDAVQASAVADAALAEDTLVLIQTGSSAFHLSGERPLAQAALAVRDRSGGQLGVHLDHSRDLDEIARCLDAGYDSVMIDGSHLPLRENIKRTRDVVELAHTYGAWVEAELGALPGDEDRSIESHGFGEMTRPADAARFAQETNVDLLAVAVGNVHGIPPQPVHLALGRLADIASATDVPLVLHGASGLPDVEVLGAIALGVCKINVNTEVRREYLRALGVSLAASTSDDLVKHFYAARAAAAAVVSSKVRLFGRSHPHHLTGTAT